ncbi:MAG: xanthine dehydrogenase accessory protein XdhC [Tropicimonas sp.]|uniref:xanthine dehydrogenase accessory protein XdhC n=1 Tax=Tropicimonas sp. TaxID=2067044 RepID=UPI003A849BC9
MSFDTGAIRQAAARHGAVMRVVVVETAGSAPREAGAAMLVWPDGQSGTIGGGRLELEAVAAARGRLAGNGGTVLGRIALGPALGQCCGGAVTLLSERFGPAELEGLEARLVAGCYLRPVGATPALREMPLSLRRRLAQYRNGSAPARIALIDGWVIEPLARAEHQLWIHGAGHVGRAVVGMMAPLEDWAVTWLDTDAGRFPAPIPARVTPLAGDMAGRIMAQAPAGAHHLILTYSHALDLELCHVLLCHGFASAGLIGSSSKWLRFRKRLRQLGHSDAAIARITCPIGDPKLGKAPQAIAIGVAALLLRGDIVSSETSMDRPA